VCVRSIMRSGATVRIRFHALIDIRLWAHFPPGKKGSPKLLA
jgi:hypothetical protein